MLNITRVSGWWVPLAAIGLVFAAHLSVGANTNALAMIYSVGVLGLGVVVYGIGSGPYWFLTNKTIIILALLFLLTLSILSLQLTPFMPGGPHPFWQWVEGAGSITLDMDATKRELIKLAALGAMAAIGLYIGVDDKRARLFFKMMLLAGTIFALWAFVSYISRRNTSTSAYVRQTARLMANFLSSNSAASLFGMLTLLSVASLSRASKQIAGGTSTAITFAERLIKSIPVSISCFLFSITALMLTASRGGIFSSLIAIFIFIGWEFLDTAKRKSNFFSIVGPVLIVAVMAVLVFLISSDIFLDRLGSLASASNERSVMIEAHWEAFKHAPWAGYGLGSFYLVNDMTMNVQNWQALHPIRATHNVYVQWLEEAGLIGALPMFTTLGVVFWSIAQGLRQRRRMRTWLRAILCISILLLLHGTVDYALQVPSIAMTWALLLGVGLGVATVRMEV